MTEGSADIPSSQTASGRRERQELDDGDPDETVWFIPQINPGGWQDEENIRGGISQGKCYHDDPSCRYLNRSTSPPRSETRKGIQRRSYAPCMDCVLDAIDSHAENAQQAIDDAQCPLCGATDFDYLPNHLTECSEGNQ